MTTLKANKFLSVNGTSLQSEVDCNYSDIAALFGRHITNDGYKVDAEWIIETPFGVGTIYNWKDGKNYLGKDGLKIKDIREWHIGGKNKETGIIIKCAIEAYCAGKYL